MADNTDNRRAIWGVPEKLQLHIAMLTLQFGYAGFHVVSRAALNMGISKLVFPVYRNIIALLLLLPFAYFLEKKERPAITLNFLIQFFFLALIGITANQGFYLLGLDYTSPTFASSMQNSALIHLSFFSWYLQSPRNSSLPPVLKKYPARLSVTSYTCFFGIIQFLIIAAFCERDSQAWVFHSGWELFTILYAGIVASGIAFAVQIWCIDRGGPVFVAVYQPVQTLVVAIMASIALGEEFYLGGIIGAVLIIAGLYFVLYGKSEERKFAALEKAEIQTIVEHGIERVPVSRGSIKSSITVPLLHQSTDNV
ncbi:BnaA02g17260D [Brassica napus]|uniref:WAT1-related protein n=1 Tax=Brassica napus TaxID=3708 RepID=A0A078HME1_BRANA|nr:BnaA02g17260D [Brassica napus]